MMLLSKFARSFWSTARKYPTKNVTAAVQHPVRHGSKRVVNVFPTAHRGYKFKKYFMTYFLIGAIPAAAIIFYSSSIVGEAELYDYDPEQYQPEFYEFFAHPITRFLAKYVMEDPRVSYYKDVYAIEFESQHRRMVQLVSSVKEIEKHMGFKGWQRWEGPISNEMHKGDIERYVEEHKIPIEVKR